MTLGSVVFHVASLLLVRTAHISASSSSLQQLSVNVGEDFVLECFYKGAEFLSMFYWYKQTMGQTPSLIAVFYQQTQLAYFYNEFEMNKRFGINHSPGRNHLNISNAQISDSATYFCMGSSVNALEFLNGTMVIVKDSRLKLPPETLQSGDSVNQKCSVKTGTCGTGHSVYWFEGSEESETGMISTHEVGEDQCENKPETQTHTCFYHLSKENLTASHTGTYRCAVASCGQILFGKIKIPDSQGTELISALSGALTFSTILIVFLTFTAYRLYKKQSYKSTDSQERPSVVPAPEAEGRQEAENLQYATLSDFSSHRPRERNDTRGECVYAGVKL